MTFKKALFSSVLTILATISQQASADIDFTPSEDGVYAVFSTTKGEFAAKLYHDQTPITVANFVGLAEGSINRWDANNQKPITGKYYDGITFHRVISGFMIQGGSPNGLGNDGPGYSIVDEIVPTLKHTRAGLLSMAKSSAANSGGSQFFVTLGAAPWLDGIHSIFGEIVAGQNVVDSIGALPVSGDRPINPPVIETITILRVGTEAQQFDPTDYPVPNIHFPKVELDLAESQSTASFPRKSNANYLIRRTTNLKDWEIDSSVVSDYSTPTSHEIDITEDIKNEGKTYIEVTEFTNNPFLDASGTTITLNLAAGDSAITTSGVTKISLTGEFEGTFTRNGTEVTASGYYWYPVGERDQLYIGLTNYRLAQFHLTWTSETEGIVTATFLNSSQFVQNGFVQTGTFTVNQKPGN